MEKYYVGWDVGAWHCDKNTNSMDAIAVLNEKGEEVVENKRKVVRCELNENSIFSFLNKYFGCKDFFKEADNFIFAIDAVFRLPIGVQDIPISEFSASDISGTSSSTTTYIIAPAAKASIYGSVHAIIS